MKTIAVIGLLIAFFSALIHRNIKNPADENWNQWREWSKPMWGMSIGILIWLTGFIYI